MKRLLLLPACLVGLTIVSQAQEKDPPSPPPPPKVEVSKKPPPPPPPKKPVIAGESVANNPAQTLEPPTVVMSKYVPPTKELDKFRKENPDVSTLYWRSEEEVVVVHKDKSQFVYNMKNDKEKEAFESKYGAIKLTEPPPPPPPPPPLKKRQQS